MNAKEFWKLLWNPEYINILSPELEATAKQENIVVITWYSDDNVLLEWKINDEVWGYDECTFLIDQKGRILENWEEIQPEIDNISMWYNTEEILKEMYEAYVENYAVEITGNFDKKGYSWYIDVKENNIMDFEYFDSMEDGEKHTRGVILKLTNDSWKN